MTTARIGTTGEMARTPHREERTDIMPRFVILEHDHPVLHWDLMLESGAILHTWRLESPPRAGEAIAATATFDHRPIYLDYEGPIHGDRGRVVRRESGTFSWQVQTKDRIVVRLDGVQLRGVLQLEHWEGSSWRGAFLADV
jgi:hypothetical protein